MDLFFTINADSSTGRIQGVYKFKSLKFVVISLLKHFNHIVRHNMTCTFVMHLLIHIQYDLADGGQRFTYGGWVMKRIPDNKKHPPNLPANGL